MMAADGFYFRACGCLFFAIVIGNKGLPENPKGCRRLFLEYIRIKEFACADLASNMAEKLLGVVP